MPEILVRHPYQAPDADAPRCMAKPTASKSLTKLTSAELDHLLHWAATHTALGRLSHVELIAAFARLEAEAGFIIVQGASNG